MLFRSFIYLIGVNFFLLDLVNYSRLIILCKRTVTTLLKAVPAKVPWPSLLLLELSVACDTVDIFLEIPFLLIVLGFFLLLQSLLIFFSSIFFWKLVFLQGFFFTLPELSYLEADQLAENQLIECQFANYLSNLLNLKIAML